MSMLWPGFLIMMGIIPVIVGIYIWILRRRRKYTVRFSSLSLVREALPHRSSWRRHLPFALFILALMSLIAALARPVAIVQVPAGQTSIILALDVSRSMCSTDVAPNRLEAAKEAAQSFIQQQSRLIQIGVVAFAGFAELVQAPTSDQEMLQESIENLTTGRRTAIGSGILKSLDAIAEVNKSIAPSENIPYSGPQPPPVPPGTYAPDIIVLLTDGASNSGPFPLIAAQQAVDRGIRVYTIGFGTAYGSSMDCSDQFWYGGSSGQGQPSGNDQFGGGFRRGIDEVTLKQIAEMTGGEYYSAESADELQNVFNDLPSYLVTRDETMEISVAFTALGALLAALAIGLALVWHPLP